MHGLSFIYTVPAAYFSRMRMCITVCVVARICTYAYVYVFLMHKTYKLIWDTNEKYAYGPYTDTHTDIRIRN